MQPFAFGEGYDGMQLIDVFGPLTSSDLPHPERKSRSPEKRLLGPPKVLPSRR